MSKELTDLPHNFSFYVMESDHKFTCNLRDKNTNESVNSVFVCDSFKDRSTCREWLELATEFYKIDRIQRYKRLLNLRLFLNKHNLY